MVNEQGSEQGSKPEPEKNRLLSALEKPFAAVSSPVKKMTNTVTKGISAAVPHPKRWASRDDVEGEESEKLVSNSATKKIADVPRQIREGTKKVGSAVSTEFGKVREKVPSFKKKAVLQVEPAGDGLPALPSDKMLESMDVIMTKMLTKVPVNDFYEMFWSEANGTDKTPFYGTWLTECGKTEIKVNEWTIAKDEEGFVGEWDKEVYSQTREVTFQFLRTSHLAPGLVNVNHTQYLRLEGNDRCVVSTMVKVSGAPFSDSFQVQLRWVATRVGERDLSIKVGMFVFFVKQVLVAGQIRTATTKETTDAQLNLFILMKKACGSEEVVVLEETKQPIDLFANMSLYCFPFFQFQQPKYTDDIDRTIQEVQEKMAIVRTLPARAGVAEKEEYRKHILSEFSNAQEALDNILIRNMGLESSVVRKKEDAVADDGASRLVNAVAAPFERFYEKHIRSGSFKVGQSSALRRLTPHRDKKPTDQEEPADRLTQEQEDGSFEPPSPDETLKSMNVIITKVLDDTSVKDFYNVCLSEGQGTDNEPFYGPWLTRSGKTDIHVEDWTVAEDEQGFVGEWDKEQYSRKRELTFKFERSSFVSQGPSIASVKQTQYCRVEGKNKCVFATTIETQGVPFSDSFNIQIRWVVTRVEKDKIAIKVGLFVVFLKKILISGKIRAGVTQESLKQQLDLFRSVKSALGGPSVEESIDEQYGLGEDAAERRPFALITSHLQSCIPRIQKMAHLYPDSMIEDDDELGKQLKTMERKIRAIDVFLEQRDPGEPTEDLNFFLAELVVVRETLDNLIQWHGDQEQGQHTIAEASFVQNA
jgi:hypothetical protein